MCSQNMKTQNKQQIQSREDFQEGRKQWKGWWVHKASHSLCFSVHLKSSMSKKECLGGTTELLGQLCLLLSVSFSLVWLCSSWTLLPVTQKQIPWFWYWRDILLLLIHSVTCAGCSRELILHTGLFLGVLILSLKGSSLHFKHHFEFLICKFLKLVWHRSWELNFENDWPPSILFYSGTG